MQSASADDDEYFGFYNVASERKVYKDQRTVTNAAYARPATGPLYTRLANECAS